MKVLVSSLVKDADSLPPTKAFNLNFGFKENLSLVQYCLAHFSAYFSDQYINDNLSSNTLNSFLGQMCLFYSTGLPMCCM